MRIFEKAFRRRGVRRLVEELRGERQTLMGKNRKLEKALRSAELRARLFERRHRDVCQERDRCLAHIDALRRQLLEAARVSGSWEAPYTEYEPERPWTEEPLN